MAVCSVCGAQYPDGNRFCPQCGAAAAAAAAGAAAASGQYQQYQQQGYDPNAGQYQPGYQQQQQQYQQPYQQPVKQKPVAPSKDAEQYRPLAILSYLCIVFAFVMLILDKDSPFVRKHANQVVALNIWFVACGVVMIVPVLGWVAGGVGMVAGLVFMIIAMVRANRYDCYEIPIFGKWNVIPQLEQKA